MRNAQGITSLAALVVADALRDFEEAPKNSPAFRTARRFLAGGECSHLLCAACADGSKDWRVAECPPGDYAEACECTHGWQVHVIATFDWTEHRNMIAEAAGIDPDVLARRTQ